MQEKLKEYLNRNYKKIIGWGTSNYYKIFSTELDLDLAYLIDSDEKKCGQVIDGKNVYLPHVLQEEKPEDVLIISFSSFYRDIRKTIQKYGKFHSISGEQLLWFSYSLDDERPGIKEEEKKVILTISGNDLFRYLSGASKFLREQMDLFIKNSYVNIHLFWSEYDIKGYRGLYLSVIKNGTHVKNYSIADFFKVIKRIKAVIIHNLIGVKLDALDLILDEIEENVPVLYYLHDFSCVCSNIKLMYNNKVYCRSWEDGWARCLTCESGEEKKAIFAYHDRLFKNRKIKLVAPSESTKEIIQKCFRIDHSKILVIPHQKYHLGEKETLRINEVLRIAYVGYKHIHKGWNTFKRLVSDFKDKYKFYCLGASDEYLDGVEYVAVSYVTDGEHAMVKKLIEYDIDVSLLLSSWPETYCYTYYESFAAGAFVVTTTESGNICDQVKKNGNGIVVHNYQELKNIFSDESWLKRLLLENNKRIIDLRNNQEDILSIINKKGW